MDKFKRNVAIRKQVDKAVDDLKKTAAVSEVIYNHSLDSVEVVIVGIDSSGRNFCRFQYYNDKNIST